MRLICPTPLQRGPFFIVNNVAFWSRGLHAWNLRRGLGSPAKVSTTRLLSCSEERLSVESKHQAYTKGAAYESTMWGKEKDSIYCKSDSEKRACKNSLTSMCRTPQPDKNVQEGLTFLLESSLKRTSYMHVKGSFYLIELSVSKLNKIEPYST